MVLAKKVLSGLALSSVSVLGGSALLNNEEVVENKDPKVVVSDSEKELIKNLSNEKEKEESLQDEKKEDVSNLDIERARLDEHLENIQNVIDRRLEDTSNLSFAAQVEPMVYQPVSETFYADQAAAILDNSVVPESNVSEVVEVSDNKKVVVETPVVHEEASNVVEVPASEVVEVSVENPVSEEVQPDVVEATSVVEHEVEIDVEDSSDSLAENLAQTEAARVVAEESARVAAEQEAQTLAQAEAERVAREQAEYEAQVAAQREAERIAAEQAAQVSESQARSGSITPTYNYNTSGSYPVGQCTWGVKVMAPWVGDYWGNGGDWAASAAAAGFRTGSTPQVGAVASWNDGGYGHVAYVTAVESNNAIQVYESNYNGIQQIGNYRGTFDPTTAQGTVTYIYPN